MAARPAAGKTDLLLGLALTAHEHSVIFRRAYVDLAGIEQRLIEILGSRVGYNGDDMVLRRPDRLIEFGALEKPGAEFSWQGRPHDFIGFDEGAQLAEAKVRFVMGWLRSTTPGQRCRVVIASNPPIGGEGEWLTTWFAPWLDPAFGNPAKPGELRWRCMRADGTFAWVDGPGTHEVDGEQLEALSCTFIPARLDDNRFLRDTGYRAQIMAMPEPLRSKLLKGDFVAGKEDAAQQVIPSAWIAAAQARWTPDGGRDRKMTTLGVDVAQGGADETVLAPLFVTWFGELVKRRGLDTTNGPAVAGPRDRAHARQMPGQCRSHRRLGRFGARSSRRAGRQCRAGRLFRGVRGADARRAARIPQHARAAVVAVPRGVSCGPEGDVHNSSLADVHQPRCKICQGIRPASCMKTLCSGCGRVVVMRGRQLRKTLSDDTLI